MGNNAAAQEESFHKPKLHSAFIHVVTSREWKCLFPETPTSHVEYSKVLYFLTQTKKLIGLFKN